MKSETPEPELLLFAGMTAQLHAAGLMEPLRNGEPTPKKVCESVQTLFASMNEIQELAATRLGSKTKMVFTLSLNTQVYLDRNQDVFSRHKADIGCCNLVEHEI